MAESPHRFVNPEGLMPPRGFSHVAVPAPGRLVFVAGQTAHRPDGGVDGDTLAEQFAAALRNLVTALDAAGARPEHLVRMEIYLTDAAAYRESLGPIGDAWRETLGRHYPAVSLFEVSGLADPQALVEIVATVVVPE
ncbi:MAG: RidA family protein [Nitriliruptorales bacterium]